jgi:hypothetical protein
MVSERLLPLFDNTSFSPVAEVNADIAHFGFTVFDPVFALGTTSKGLLFRRRFFLSSGRGCGGRLVFSFSV